MATSTTQLLAAYDRSRSRISSVRKQLERSLGLGNLDKLEQKVRERFILGVHQAYTIAIIRALVQHVGRQQEIADALGLEDRTSISKMIHTGRMDGLRITAALQLLGDKVVLPTQEQATLHGFARTTSFIKAQVERDDSIEGTMSAQEFSFLVGTLADEKWDDALKNTNPTVAREVAVRIVKSRTLEGESPDVGRKYRPEQWVMMLRALEDSWAEFGIAALYAIPQSIPVDDSDSEVML